MTINPEDFFHSTVDSQLHNKYWIYSGDNTANPNPGYPIYPYAPGSPIDLEPYYVPYTPTEVAPLTFNSTNVTLNPCYTLQGKKIVLILSDDSEIEGVVVAQPPNCIFTDNWLILETKFSKNHYFNKSMIKSFYIKENE